MHGNYTNTDDSNPAPNCNAMEVQADCTAQTTKTVLGKVEGIFKLNILVERKGSTN